MFPLKIPGSAVTALIAFVLAFDLAFAAQKLSGAYRSEFGGHPHEAAHFISSLFWRDFIVSYLRGRSEGSRETFGATKAKFAAQWEAHYPYIETGARPSLFTALEAAWMVAFPATRGSLLILMAGLSGLLATLLYVVFRKEFGAVLAGLASALLLLLPLVRDSAAMAMPDGLSTVLIFGFALGVGEFLDRRENRERHLAALFGAVLVLTNVLEDDASLVFVVFLAALLIAGGLRFHWRTEIDWFPQIMRGILWLVIAYLALKGHIFEGFRKHNIPLILLRFEAVLGSVLAGLLSVGILIKLKEIGKPSGRWIAAGALLIAVALRLVFTSGINEPRYWLPCLPAALMFALAGARWLVNRLTSPHVAGTNQPRFRAGLAALFTLLTFSSAVGHLTSTVNTGFAPLVETLIEDSSSEDATLVSSDADGEERFIAELVVREARPGHIVLSGTRALGHPGKKGASDEPVFESDAAMFVFLTSGKIRYIVLDDSIPDDGRREHHYQIKRAIDAHLDRFWSIATCPITREGVPQTTPATLYKFREGN